ncbi:serine protease [Orbilia ellipsospora]|uniref:Serine protease n=1 Tax=Orbilia ellipsospora TaxID=2528407 RepID=A0AAV9XP76_9PEZI
MYFLSSTFLLLLAATTTSTPLPHNGENHDTPSQTSSSIPSPHPTTFSNYIFRFPTPSNGTKVDTSKILTSLAPHGFDMSHLHHTFSETMNGFAAHMSDHCVSILQNMDLPGGVIIEPVATFKPSTPIPASRSGNSDDATKRGLGTSARTVDGYFPQGIAGQDIFQNTSTWGLQRINQRETIALKYDQLDTGANFEYTFDGSDGVGVDIYILDMGVNAAHVDFLGLKATGLVSRVNATYTAPELLLDHDEGSEDHGGHGTHCAGTAGSLHYGVAKEPFIHSIKVLRAEKGGLSSDIIAGIEFITQRHKSRLGDPFFRGSVASLSFGLEIPTDQLTNKSYTVTSPSLEAALIAANVAGIHTIVAAGNQNIDACRTSPGFLSNVARPELGYTGSVITVGASDIHDNRAAFSNYGPCITTYAPGVDVLSTFIGAENNNTQVMSGTSMATPHVAGLVAYILSMRPELRDNTRAMKDLVMNLATQHKLGNIPDGIEDSKLIAFNGGQDFFYGTIEPDTP